MHRHLNIVQEWTNSPRIQLSETLLKYLNLARLDGVKDREQINIMLKWLNIKILSIYSGHKNSYANCQLIGSTQEIMIYC